MTFANRDVIRDSPIFVGHGFRDQPSVGARARKNWDRPLQERPPDARIHTVLCRPGGKQRPSRNLLGEVAFFHVAVRGDTNRHGIVTW